MKDLLLKLICVVIAVIGGTTLYFYWVFLIPIGEFYVEGFFAAISGLLLFGLGIGFLIAISDRK